MKSKQLIFCVALFCAVCGSAKAQTNEKYVGVYTSMGAEFEVYNQTEVTFMYEHKFSKYFAYNFGLGVSQWHLRYPVPISHNFVTVPVNIKFDSNVLNFGLGVYYSVHTNPYGPLASSITSFSVDNCFGASLFLSKNINLTEKFVLEPEVKYQLNTYCSHIFSVGMKLKYKL